MSKNCAAVIRHSLLLIFVFLILLLNVPTPQAASTERIWLDKAEEGGLQAGGEEDALDVEDGPEEGEGEVEEPGRASNPLAPAGGWVRFRERVKDFLRGRGCRGGGCLEATRHYPIVRIPF
ncbi:hypothetical protein AAHC03_019193 [Spirometra sp. Aus1]